MRRKSFAWIKTAAFGETAGLVGSASSFWGRALCLAGWFLGVAGAGVADSATLDITYTSGGGLEVAAGSGTAVTSGTTIPAGLLPRRRVRPRRRHDPQPDHQRAWRFTFDHLGMEVDQPQTLGPDSFAPSSTYTVEDTNIGPALLVTFTTSATAPASGGSSGASSGGSSLSSGGAVSIETSSSGGSGSSSHDAASSAGSSSMTIAGTIKATISAGGKLALTYDRKTLKTLKAGRYTFTVVNHSKQSGLFIGKGSSVAAALSRVGAEGTTSSHTVNLSVGTWFYEATLRGAHTVFTVTSL